MWKIIMFGLVSGYINLIEFNGHVDLLVRNTIKLRIRDLTGE